jgi:hypothetical protein
LNQDSKQRLVISILRHSELWFRSGFETGTFVAAGTGESFETGTSVAAGTGESFETGTSVAAETGESRFVTVLQCCEI